MWFLLYACSPDVAPPPVEEVEAPVPVPEDPVGAAMDFAMTRPIYERPLGDGRKPVPGVPNLSADTCAMCHADIAEEWRTSVHSQAWIDRQFQEEIKKSDNRWLCVNCHAPLQIQQDKLAIGLHDDDVERPILVDNPSYDAALRDEGITCAACHVRDGVIHGPGIGGTPPHPVQADESYRNGELCQRCHQATATYPGKNFVCTFDTGNEWKAGPYDDEGKTCVDCHMPPETRPAATGGEPKRVGRHWWRGAGIPKIAGRYPPPEANAFGLDLTASAEAGVLTLQATNANAGHMLPTGDPERKVIVTASFLGADGEEVGRNDWVFGQEWTWSPPTKHGDTRLAPRETRPLAIDVPQGAARVVVTGVNERMSEKNRAYHHLDGYPIQVETHRMVIELSAP